MTDYFSFKVLTINFIFVSTCMSEKIKNYFNLLGQWLKYYGFSEIKVNEAAGADKVYLRSRVEATKFGNVSFYICVKHIENATPDSLRDFSTKMFSLAHRHCTGPPLGFGAMLQVFPLVVTENISAEAAQFVKTYCAKHFAASEFPSIIDVNTGYLYFYPATPLWGYAYYSGYRRDAYNYFSPEAWKKVSG
jgi:hypothetical protein